MCLTMYSSNDDSVACRCGSAVFKLWCKAVLMFAKIAKLHSILKCGVEKAGRKCSIHLLLKTCSMYYLYHL